MTNETLKDSAGLLHFRKMIFCRMKVILVGRSTGSTVEFYHALSVWLSGWCPCNVVCCQQMQHAMQKLQYDNVTVTLSAACTYSRTPTVGQSLCDLTQGWVIPAVARSLYLTG